MDSTLAERKFIGAVEDEWLMYSDNAADYTRLSPIGFGASSIVYQAVYHYKIPQTGKVKDMPCALKVLNLDKLTPPALRLLTRETQLMSLNKHPNVLRVRGCWMMGPQLYIAVRLMNKGSVADIIKYSFIDGLEEDVVKCILYQALQGLNYLHINGFIHRDIKAANLLVDDDGTVLLGDLGVAVSLSDEEDAGQNGMMNAVRNGYGASSSGPLVYGARPKLPTNPSTDSKVTLKKRKSFVGTPSWMAPEVITQQQYDSSADIWSLGITVIEMCMGRAPGSRERDVKRVLLSTLQNAPPTLDRDAGKFKYSKGLKEFVDSCLVKDPAQRPTAEALLKHDIFKNVKKKNYLVGTLLVGLPPLVDRQERQVINPLQPHQPQKHKAHPLALGSPSLTSVHNTRFSWDWNFSNPGSPRSTIYGKHDGGGNNKTPGSADGHGHGASPNGSATSLPLHHHPHPHPPGVPYLPGSSVGSHTRSRSRTSTTGSFDTRPTSTSPTHLRNHSRVGSYVAPHELDVDEEEEEENNSEEMKAINAKLEQFGVNLSSSPLQRSMMGLEEPLLANDVVDTGGLDTPGGNSAILATPHMHPELQPYSGEIDPDTLALPDVSSSASSLSPPTPPAGLSSQLENNPNEPNQTSPVLILNASNPNTPRSSPTVQAFFGTKEPPSGTGTTLKAAAKQPPVGAPVSNSNSGGGTVKEGSRSRLWKKVRNALPDRKSSQSNVKESLNNNVVGAPDGGDAKKVSSAASRMFKLERPWSRT
ncbi:hypothetical protein FRC04_011238 [Tulasnella sp. 424]|nr:hypothetical protein FRC04_011238 [Tulasnella sp. 424]KAG8971771.1 hypothetical protein FRC05_010838 [Tulasnella sp. 425]